MTGDSPPRGFPQAEFEARTARAQRMMAAASLDALLLTTEPEFRYFSGFHTSFWQSPTRPWFLIVPASGAPVAVIPEIGLASMSRTWVSDIRAWPAPRPADDGVSLLADALQEQGGGGGRIGMPFGHETHVRMPHNDFMALRDRLSDTAFTDATAIVRSLRMVKSEAEIAKIRHVCALVSDGFANLPNLIGPGDSERGIFRTFAIELLSRGVDEIPYLVGGTGPGGFDDVIGKPSGRRLQKGDMLMLDTGSSFDGYYCDFDRNFAVGTASDAAKRAYDTVFRATDAGLAAVRPGARASDLWRAMAKVLEDGGSQGNEVGRFGHGLGMQITEWPSNIPGDDTELVPGMVLTLEPGMIFQPGCMMLHEENLVVREDGPELLTRRAAPELPIIG